MLNLLKNLPIFRRLFLAFSLAVLIPDLIIIFLGNSYTQILNAHGIGSAQTGPLLLETIIALLVSTGVVIALGFIVNITISQPLRQLAYLTRRIRKGDTRARAEIAGNDEISMVALSMNSMLDNIVQLIQETQSQRDHLQSQIEKLIHEVSGVGEGDLRIQAEITSGALGALADSFNYMVEELSGLIVRVKVVSRGVGLSANHTHERMTELVQVADRQLQQIITAAGQAEHMAQTSRRAVERIQILDESSSATRLFAQSGRATVQKTIEKIGRVGSNVQETARRVLVLEERSREINEIVEVISGIAHLTNRLALDAAIQATMAGENGKGFRAVVDDIRRLAERSKQQTNLITQIVRRVREDIGTATLSMQETVNETSEGATLVQETGTEFEKIFTAVEKQAQDSQIISQMVRTLQQSSSSLVQFTQVISVTTQQSSVSTRDVSSNMAVLARQAGELLGSVEAFKLREEIALPGNYAPSSSELRLIGETQRER